MSEGSFDTSTIILLFFTGFAGGMVGYIIKRLESFQNKKDELRAQTIPSIYAATTLFLKSVELLKNEQLKRKDLIQKIKDIVESMNKQIFEEGGITYMKESRRNNIYDFYFHLSLLPSSLDDIKREDLLREKFSDEDHKLGGISVSTLLELAEQVKSDVIVESKEYDYRNPIIMILLLGLLGAITTILALLQK